MCNKKYNLYYIYIIYILFVIIYIIIIIKYYFISEAKLKLNLKTKKINTFAT